MAFASKYYFSFYDNAGIQFFVYLQQDGYGGGLTEITKVAEDPLHIIWETDDAEDKFSPLVKSTATINFIITSSGANLREIITATPMQYRIYITKSGAPYWFGMVLNGYYNEPYTETYPYAITLTAVCGIAWLQDIPYSDGSGNILIGNDSLLNILIRCLEKVNPGLDFLDGINLIEASQTDSNTTSALYQTYLYQELFCNDQEQDPTPWSCADVIKEIARAFGARIMQTDGSRFSIIRISELSASFHYVVYRAGAYYFNSSVNVVKDFTQVGSGIANRVVPVGGNGILSAKLPVQAVKLNHNYGLKKNMLFNGAFNIWQSSAPLGWTLSMATAPTRNLDLNEGYYLYFVSEVAANTMYQNIYDASNSLYEQLVFKIRYKNFNTNQIAIRIKSVGATNYWLDDSPAWQTSVQYLLISAYHPTWTEYSFTIPALSTTNKTLEITIFPSYNAGAGCAISLISLLSLNKNPQNHAYNTTINNLNKKVLQTDNLLVGDENDSKQGEDKWGCLFKSATAGDISVNWGPKGGTKNKKLLQILNDDMVNQYDTAHFMLSSDVDGSLSPLTILNDSTDGNRKYMPVRMDYNALERIYSIDAIELLP